MMTDPSEVDVAEIPLDELVSYADQLDLLSGMLENYTRAAVWVGANALRRLAKDIAIGAATEPAAGDEKVREILDSFEELRASCRDLIGRIAERDLRSELGEPAGAHRGRHRHIPLTVVTDIEQQWRESLKGGSYRIGEPEPPTIAEPVFLGTLTCEPSADNPLRGEMVRRNQDGTEIERWPDRHPFAAYINGEPGSGPRQPAR